MVSDLIKDDPYLQPYSSQLQARTDRFKETLSKIGDLDKFSQGHKYFGFNPSDSSKLIYREWAPGAKNAFLTGDFNNWAKVQMSVDEFGVWSTEVDHIPRNTKVKIILELSDGSIVYRVPAYIKRAVQDNNGSFDGVYVADDFKFSHPRPPKPASLKIYECHIGIASPEGKVASYDQFRINVLPRVHKLGYNAIQIMAIMEHPYYASFGYQVSSFFAPSSRFGSIESLKKLIDTAHSMSISCFLDVVHSHASKNVLDGLNMFDDHQYFHSGDRGTHPLWDSRLFNYSHYEVLRFLLSNLRYWIQDFCFDGFRFDGVTSMLYHHHGLGTTFNTYDDYFGGQVDQDAINYLMLANHYIKTEFPFVITIAEDVSGMPTLCRPVSEGGIGFDYRLSLGVPDMWIKLLKSVPDDDWSMGDIVHTLTNKRWNENTIAYCESHDQALVGDKTIAFWLMDKEMYTHMSIHCPRTPIIDRGLALHKMIRLLTLGLGGRGYLSFIGNEFGHPEWLDFPREGNNNSYHYSRRQFQLVDDESLFYKSLNDFDSAMIHLDNQFHFLEMVEYVSLKHEDDKIIVFEKGNLLFIFNFHPSKSFVDYKIGTKFGGPHSYLLSTDRKEYGGTNRIDEKAVHVGNNGGWCGRERSIMVYLPSRCAIVLQGHE